MVVDEAHAMPMESMEEVRRLSNLETAKGKLINIILFGQPELIELFDLAARGLVHAEHSVYSLDDAPRAYRDLAEGRVKGRAVIVP